jgi:hypothetical protein
MFKGALTVDKDGVIEGDGFLFSLIQTKTLMDGKNEIELNGSPWCG